MQIQFYQGNGDEIINQICKHLINLDKLNTIRTDDNEDEEEDNANEDRFSDVMRQG